MHEYQILRHIDDPQMTAVPKKKAILNQEKQGVCIYMQMKRALITFKEVQYKNAVVFYICGSMLKANGNTISKNIILKL